MHNFSDLEQFERDVNMRSFRSLPDNMIHTVLVATHLAGRGLDIAHVNHVSQSINVSKSVVSAVMHSVNQLDSQSVHSVSQPVSQSMLHIRLYSTICRRIPGSATTSTKSDAQGVWGIGGVPSASMILNEIRTLQEN